MGLPTSNRGKIVERILLEVEEQERTWGPNGERAAQPSSLWLTVLAEEVGEAARAVCERWNGNADNLDEELVQVAAVAISWLEAEAIRQEVERL